jgi:hypothetical protein
VLLKLTQPRKISERLALRGERERERERELLGNSRKRKGDLKFD